MNDERIVNETNKPQPIVNRIVFADQIGQCPSSITFVFLNTLVVTHNADQRFDISAQAAKQSRMTKVSPRIHGPLDLWHKLVIAKCRLPNEFQKESFGAVPLGFLQSWRRISGRLAQTSADFMNSVITDEGVRLIRIAAVDPRGRLCRAARKALLRARFVRRHRHSCAGRGISTAR